MQSFHCLWNVSAAASHKKDVGQAALQFDFVVVDG